MKKGIMWIFILLWVYFLCGTGMAFAFIDTNGVEQVWPPAPSSWWPTTVTVTEKIPGMKCVSDPKSDEKDVTKKKYKCTIEPGFGSVMLILKGLIKYATFITALIGILMLVYSGMEYSMSGASGWDSKHAKERIIKVLSGIVLLFLVGFILNSVAPWIYR